MKGTRQMLESIVRLLKTVVGVICIATTLALAALMLQDLLNPVPLSISYAQVATMILIGGLITGFALFFMDARSRRSG